MTAVLFRERLSVPVGWWVLATFFALSLLLALGLYVGPVWGVGVAAASLLVAAGLFASAAVTITVDATEIRVGRAIIAGGRLRLSLVGAGVRYSEHSVLDVAATDVGRIGHAAGAARTGSTQRRVRPPNLRAARIAPGRRVVVPVQGRYAVAG